MATLTALSNGLTAIDEITNVNGTVFFVASEVNAGRELFKSDGTTTGTVIVKNITPGIGNTNPVLLTSVGSTLFFVTNSGLYKSDGTDAGTVIIPDIPNRGKGGLTNINGTLYFRLSGTLASFVTTLVKTDGTSAGTSTIPFPSGVSNPGTFFNINNTIFFEATGSNGRELYKTDGTAAGTVLVTDIFPGASSSNIDNLTVVNDLIYFTADNGNNGKELYVTDGTLAGTRLVSDIRPGTEGSNPDNLINVNGTLFFTANSDRLGGRKLYKTDGTAAGTVVLRDGLGTDFGDDKFVAINNTLFYESGFGLFKSDGTVAGTSQVVLPTGVIFPNNITKVGNKLYFTAGNVTTGTGTGTELYVTDGTTAGTRLVKDINPGLASSNPSELTDVNGILYFKANDGTGERLFSYEDSNPSPISKLNSPIRRFQNTSQRGTYLFAGEEESASIRNNFKNFQEEGLAFQVGVEKNDPLLQPLFRFQNTSKSGTYIFVREEERQSILTNFKNFKEEGLAFYVYGASSGIGTTYNRFQNTSQPGTYLFAGPEESLSILANFKNFVLEGAAFNVG
jgi:ELWxxDGT repeat protein